jgi:hypothetical protein
VYLLSGLRGIGADCRVAGGTQAESSSNGDGMRALALVQHLQADADSMSQQLP